MQTLQSRLYVNVILTVIAILLAVIAFQPLVRLSSPALAQERGGRNAEQRTRLSDLEGAQYDQFAAATREVAAANQDIAKAIREAAKSQDSIAKAIGKLSFEK